MHEKPVKYLNYVGDFNGNNGDPFLCCDTPYGLANVRMCSDGTPVYQ